MRSFFMLRSIACSMSRASASELYTFAKFICMFLSEVADLGQSNSLIISLLMLSRILTNSAFVIVTFPSSQSGSSMFVGYTRGFSAGSCFTSSLTSCLTKPLCFGSNASLSPLPLNSSFSSGFTPSAVLDSVRALGFLKSSSEGVSSRRSLVFCLRSSVSLA